MHIPRTGNDLVLREMPGFGPATELVAWRVPKGATFVVEQKDPKPLTPRPALINVDASHGRAAQLAEPVLSRAEGLRQGPPVHESVHPWGRMAGVGEMAFRDPGERPPTV